MLLANLTVADLAKKTNVAEYTLKRILANSYQPSTAIARKIAYALKLTDDEIITVFFSELKKMSFEEVLLKDQLKSRMTK